MVRLADSAHPVIERQRPGGIRPVTCSAGAVTWLLAPEITWALRRVPASNTAPPFRVNAVPTVGTIAAVGEQGLSDRVE